MRKHWRRFASTGVVGGKHLIICIPGAVDELRDCGGRHDERPDYALAHVLTGRDEMRSESLCFWSAMFKIAPAWAVIKYRQPGKWLLMRTLLLSVPSRCSNPSVTASVSPCVEHKKRRWAAMVHWPNTIMSMSSVVPGNSPRRDSRSPSGELHTVVLCWSRYGELQQSYQQHRAHTSARG